MDVRTHADQKEMYFITVTFTGSFFLLFMGFFLYLQNSSSGEKSWEVLLGHVISELSKGKIYEGGDTEELTVVLENVLRINPACPFLPLIISESFL